MPQALLGKLPKTAIGKHIHVNTVVTKSDNASNTRLWVTKIDVLTQEEFPALFWMMHRG